MRMMPWECRAIPGLYYLFACFFGRGGFFILLAHSRRARGCSVGDGRLREILVLLLIGHRASLPKNFLPNRPPPPPVYICLCVCVSVSGDSAKIRANSDMLLPSTPRASHYHWIISTAAGACMCVCLGGGLCAIRAED